MQELLKCSFQEHLKYSSVTLSTCIYQRYIDAIHISSFSFVFPWFQNTWRIRYYRKKPIKFCILLLKKILALYRLPVNLHFFHKKNPNPLKTTKPPNKTKNPKHKSHSTHKSIKATRKTKTKPNLTEIKKIHLYGINILYRYRFGWYSCCGSFSKRLTRIES